MTLGFWVEWVDKSGMHHFMRGNKGFYTKDEALSICRRYRKVGYAAREIVAMT